MRQSILCAIVVVLTSPLFISGEALAQENISRFELGGQFSLLARNNPDSQFEVSTPRHVNDSGFGGRFTYNVTKNIAFEAEVNFFPREIRGFGLPEGHIYQGQFGVKAGKRFKRFGVFGKLRPGFVGFTKVSYFTGSRPGVVEVPFGELRFNIPEFGFRKETYGSVDVGGALEFYPSRRIVTRLDLGDTIINYNVYRENDLGIVCAFVCIPRVFERPPQTKHNLQVSAGIGIRF
jgi:hypothetical protein